MKLDGASQQRPQHPLEGRPAQHRLQLSLLQGETRNGVNKNSQSVINIYIDMCKIRIHTKRINMLPVVIYFLIDVHPSVAQLTLVLKCGGVVDTVNPSLQHHHRYLLPGWNVEGRCGA